VKVIEADEKGRVRLSMKAAAEEDAQSGRAPQAQSPSTEPAAADAPPIGMAE
jgi:predicted RNA-binding protein with RPS1 domain